MSETPAGTLEFVNPCRFNLSTNIPEFPDSCRLDSYDKFTMSYYADNNSSAMSTTINGTLLFSEDYSQMYIIGSKTSIQDNSFLGTVMLIFEMAE